MKKIYLIQYKKNIDPSFENRIKMLSSNWTKYFEDNFLVESDLNPKQIYERLALGFEDKSVLIIEISKTNYYGRMNTSLWDWLKQRK